MLQGCKEEISMHWSDLIPPVCAGVGLILIVLTLVYVS